MLRQQSQSTAAHLIRRRSSPFVATLLSFVPGLGAAYNGQTSKAIVHFAIFASFFQMAVIAWNSFLCPGRGLRRGSLQPSMPAAQRNNAGGSRRHEDDVIARRL